MPDAMVTIISALIGAGLGSLGAAYLTFVLGQRAEKQRLQESVVYRYLSQLQDAADSLWHRLDNVKNRGGRAVMQDRYFEISTLYALGRVLAFERILLLDGIYPQLEQLRKGLGIFLRNGLQQIDKELSNIRFQHYNRLALAESAIVKEKDRLRASTYLEFWQYYEKEDSLVRASLKPAKGYLAELEGPELTGVLRELAAIAKRLEDETRMPSTVRSAA
jgi:hypothetical protein